MKRGVMNFKWLAAVMMVAVMIVVPACSEDEGGVSNKYVNEWIYVNMEYFYYWTDDLPTYHSTSTDPEDYFNSLLSTEDRFSWIDPNFNELIKSLSGINKEAGYEYKLYQRSGTNDVIAQVMYIKEGSLVETENKDLKRGDIITHINGDKMTIDNYSSLLGKTSKNHTITYTRPTDGAEVAMGTLSLTVAEYAENPHFMHKVIETGGHKIGYYVYNFFAVGPNDNSDTYNDEMDAIFAEFKSAGITDLVVDLRYNSGGAEDATINLASLIGANIDNTMLFTKRQFNEQLQADILATPSLGTNYINKKFVTKTENVGALLNNDRVYILTSNRTASASELLINGLKPYMDVFLIGNVTVGKNVGSFTLTDEDNPNNKWGMQPIVVKSFNSLDQSDYSEGFQPNILELDNDLNLLPIGDEDELLLSLAIGHITGSEARRDQSARKQFDESIGNSADFKRGGYNLFIDGKPLKRFIKPSQPELK